MAQPKLSKLELQILEALWVQGRASIREIQEAFPEPRPAYTTIQTTVYRLEGKKAVRRIRKISNARYFRADSAQGPYPGAGSSTEILSFFGGRPQSMMAQLGGAGKLTLEEMFASWRRPSRGSSCNRKRKGQVNRNDRCQWSNHLWQSTLFAIAAGVLTLAFRKNRAKVRYWLWLAASFKFLIPLALLMSLGSRLEWAPAAKKIATQAGSFAMVQMAQAVSRCAVLGAPHTGRDQLGTRGHFRCVGVRVRGDRSDTVAGLAPDPGRSAFERPLKDFPVRDLRCALLRACWNRASWGCGAPSCSCLLES